MLEAYRLRWQIELTFKRLKSITQLGHVPKYDGKSSRAWLYGKLLIALLIQKIARIGKTISLWGNLTRLNRSRRLLLELQRESHPLGIRHLICRLALEQLAERYVFAALSSREALPS